MLRNCAVIAMALLLFMLGITNGYCSDDLPKRRPIPMYVVADYAIEGGVGDEDGHDPYCTYYPKGSFIYNWQYGDDDYIIIDWVGDSGLIHEKFLSLMPPEVKAPVFVDDCEEEVFMFDAPSAKASVVGVLAPHTRIDEWNIYNSHFLHVKENGKEGYVSLDYITQPTFNGHEFASVGALTVGKCKEWVSLRSEASVKSERLIKVPKGTVIEKWKEWNEEFHFCEVDGKMGYILSEYLLHS